MTLTRGDRKTIKEIVQEETSGLQEEFSKLRNDATSLLDSLTEVKERVELLPTKQEFFSKMDEVVGELKTIRQEQEAIAKISRRHEDRIASFEKIHPGGRHAPN